MNDWEQIEVLKANVIAACQEHDCEPTVLDIELSADQYTEEANFYLRHVGRWTELLGVGLVRVHIGGPYRWPPP